MDEYDLLKLQETILMKKLELVRIGIEYVTLEKSKQQKVISTPSMETCQVEAIPEKTAPGKESTNPLIAVDLLKIQSEVQTSATLDKPSYLNLGPNGEISIQTNLLSNH